MNQLLFSQIYYYAVEALLGDKGNSKSIKSYVTKLQQELCKRGVSQGTPINLCAAKVVDPSFHKDLAFDLAKSELANYLFMDKSGQEILLKGYSYLLSIGIEIEPLIVNSSGQQKTNIYGGKFANPSDFAISKSNTNAKYIRHDSRTGNNGTTYLQKGAVRSATENRKEAPTKGTKESRNTNQSQNSIEVPTVTYQEAIETYPTKNTKNQKGFPWMWLVVGGVVLYVLVKDRR